MNVLKLFHIFSINNRRLLPIFPPGTNTLPPFLRHLLTGSFSRHLALASALWGGFRASLLPRGGLFLLSVPGPLPGGGFCHPERVQVLGEGSVVLTLPCPVLSTLSV